MALSGVWRGAPARADAAEGAERAVATPSLPFLELDGTIVGSVGSFSGGNP